MSWFKYGVNFWGQKYLDVAIYDDGERVLVESEIFKGNFNRLIVSVGKFESLRFLSACSKNLRDLTLQGSVTASFSGLESLTGLVDLKCDVVSQKPYPDFSQLAHLESCFLMWDKKYDAKGYQHGLFNLRGLKDLTLRYWTKPDCKEIAQLKQLNRLDLRQGVLASLEGLEGCSNLKALELSYLPKLTDIGCLDDLQSIEKIHVENCPHIADYGPMTRLKNMRYIHFEKIAAQFQDVSWLRKMHQLEKICLSCDVLEIDWTELFNHPTLKSVAIRSHEGYSVSDSEILKLAESASRKVCNFKRLGTKKLPSFVFDLE